VSRLRRRMSRSLRRLEAPIPDSASSHSCPAVSRTSTRYRMTSLAVRIPPATFTRTRRPLQARLPLLSTWPGHVDPKSTYWYLQTVPELLTLTAGRPEQAEGEAAR
jgi:hypothetical protein